MTTDNTAMAQQMFISQKKDPTLYLVLALLLGGLGVHHFYIGRTMAGVMHLLFCWTFIPAILSIFHAINYKKAVQDVNMEAAQRIAMTMSVPGGEVTKLAMI